MRHPIDGAKPCPFCGGERWASTIGNNGTRKRSATIGCGSCQAQITVGALRFSLEWAEDKALESWNKRVDEAEASKALGGG